MALWDFVILGFFELDTNTLKTVWIPLW
jgi:hypothetical protein